ncbi:LysR substrate-binding domain-containing protein [Algihabitans sp.]|uniref:LysR substrate-binding domain-containing protein n=1 Tax=Algihabitans sp. TaxID=2821514 RepID=UPI003BAB8C4A
MNALRAFDAAARHLNFRRAADELNVTQGAVAQQVRRLEADLSLQLFHREARGLSLTEIGRRYHDPVRQGFALLEQATLSLRPESPRVTLSVPPSFASKWLIPRLASLSEAHPDIDLQVLATESLADFQTDDVDIAVRQGRPPFGHGLQATLLSALELCAVCSPDYARSAAAIASFEDFAQHALIQDSHRHWDVLFAQAGLPIGRRSLQLNQAALAMDAAANGQGIALAPRLLLSADLAEGRLVELWRDQRPDQNGFYIVYPSERAPRVTITRVIGWILSHPDAAGQGSKR